MTDFSKYLNLFDSLVPPVEEWQMRNMHCSMAIYKNRIISVGFNQKKTNPTNLRNKKINSSGVDYSQSGFTCSEYSCLNRVRRKTNISFNKITIINIRVDRNGKIRNSAPCRSCQDLFRWISLSKVYHTTDDGDFKSFPEIS